MNPTASVAMMAAFAVSGCAAPDTPLPPTVRNPALNCPTPPARSLLMWFGEREVAPGGTLDLRVLWVQGPNHFVPLAAHCVTGWRLDAQAPASLDQAAARLAIRADAADGHVFKLQAHVGDSPVAGTVRVVDSSLHPLKGIWTQTHEIACGSTDRQAPSQRVGELKFTGSGQFSLTLQPFERYVDYGGNYRFSPSTGQLTLEPTTGSRLPVLRRWTGAARLTPLGELVVERLPEPSGSPAAQTPAKICEQVFRRS
jgi:hypothetical protein